MAASQLTIYNGALRMLGERKLASLSENREPRRVLDDAWADGAVNYCLEQGLWTFAIRSSKFQNDPSIAPSYGYMFGFGKPDDYVQTAAVCSDPYYNFPLTQYQDEAGVWYSDLNTLYIQYVSNADGWGNNFGKWPPSFNNFVEAYLAQQVAPRLTQSKDKKDDIDKEYKRSRTEALAKDALKQPAKFLPVGTWAGARLRMRGWINGRAGQP